MNTTIYGCINLKKKNHYLQVPWGSHGFIERTKLVIIAYIQHQLMNIMLVADFVFEIICHKDTSSNDLFHVHCLHGFWFENLMSYFSILTL